MGKNTHIATSWGRSCDLPQLTSVGAELGLSPEGVRLNEGRAIAKLRDGLADVEVPLEDAKLFMRALRGAYAQRRAVDQLAEELADRAHQYLRSHPGVSFETAIQKASAEMFPA